MAIVWAKKVFKWLRKLRTIAWLWYCGVDVWHFDRLSRKTLDQLLEEVENQEVTLTYDAVYRRVVRIPLTVAVLIRVLSENVWLRETKRVFRNGDVDEKLKYWSMTETQRKGEEILAAACRGLREELGLIVTPNQFNLYHPILQFYPKYLSTAYHGIWTYSVITRYTLDLPARPWPEEVKVIVDNGTEIHFKWVPLEGTDQWYPIY